MTTPSTKPAGSTRRRYVLLIGALVLVAAGWSAAWFYGRSELAGQIDLQLAGLSRQGFEVSCQDLSIAGYPFRYEVRCHDVVSSNKAGATGTLGTLTAVALIYNPWHVIFEAGGPARLTDPLQGLAGDFGWESARASLKMSEGSLGALDAVVSKPDAVIEGPYSAGLFAADKAEVHLREAPNLPGALESFLSLTALKLKSLPDLKETVSLRAQSRITGGMGLFAGANTAQLVQANDGELPVELVLFEATLGESRVNAAGDLVVSGDGMLSGTLDLTVGNADALLETLKPLFPPQDSSLALLDGVLKSLEPSAQEIDGVSTIALPVQIDHGLVRIGLLPLGQIPPLFQAGT
ncbi:DUF2125 domain-containing protein [Roseibium sp.]|uniref:DUF2125 domain-containing protein n=1 Tax=Roseibium sp. TaxID=1936156 RepID=UPI003D145FB1